MNNQQQFKGYECYPLWSVLLDNLISYSVYAAGIYLLFLVHPVAAGIFFIYALYLEWSIYKEGCIHCYYYGRICHSGKGALAKLFFKQGSAKAFTERTVGLKDFIPQLLGSVIPIAAGIYLLIINFSWIILGLTLWPVIIWFLGNPIVFGKLACPHCRQAEICCPVYKMFSKGSK
ncbi:MAG: hypothetical protein KKA31_02460 [Candidatus Margulisbacteria bacterium]|nr:hypothetical protein [Candidatus Margulisiibacteriota bacterium]